MKTIKATILALLVMVGAVTATGCGNAAAETVTQYLEAQKAADAKAQVKLMRAGDQEDARKEVAAAIEADKAAGNSLKSFEILETETDSSNALIKVKVVRVKEGKEVTGEEQYVLDKEDGKWRINKNMTDILMWAVEYK